MTSPATPIAAVEEYRSLSAASILVIDDEPGMRNFLTKILQPRARRVEQAASAQEATRRLDEAHFDLV
ncbi:MAG: response regulator, partial [Rhodobacteraceae bacterium]|nr:response regulator [Paracoccaceae bacterium]